MTSIWVDSMGFSARDSGCVRFEGMTITHIPEASMETIMAHIEDCVLPGIKQHIRETLDGTKAKEHAQIKADIASGKVKVESYNPLWCPDSPTVTAGTVEELYPSGYVRHADGTVEAKSE